MHDPVCVCVCVSQVLNDLTWCDYASVPVGVQKAAFQTNALKLLSKILKPNPISSVQKTMTLILREKLL